MPENGSSGIKAKFHEWLTGIKRRGAPLWFYKVWGSRYARAGVPDYLICVGGQTLAIELKAPEKAPEPSPIQARELADLVHAGALTLCTNDLDEAQAHVLGALSSAGWSSHSR